MDAQGLESFVSEPAAVAGEGVGPQLVQFVAVAFKPKLPCQGFTGAGFVETSTAKNPALAIPVMVPEAGLYTLDFRYANGNGPVNTENKCAICTLRSGGGACSVPWYCPSAAPASGRTGALSTPRWCASKKVKYPASGPGARQHQHEHRREPGHA